MGASRAHGADHDHAHGSGAAGRLGGVLVLSLAVVAVEILGARWSGSLALAADAGHMLADVSSLALALFATWVAMRPATPEKTYGYYRAEILAALVNALVLLLVSLGLLWESYERFRTPRQILIGPMLAVALVGLGANVAGAFLLHSHARQSLNIKAAYVEVLADGLSSVGVLIAGLVIWRTGWLPIDPLVSAAIALFLLPRTWHLLTQAVNILLEGTPPHLELGAVEAAMCAVPGVRRIHDLHVWTLSSGREAMSAHVVVDHVGDSERLLEDLHNLLHARFGIDHTTIQLDLEPGALLHIKGGPPARDRA